MRDLHWVLALLKKMVPSSTPFSPFTATHRIRFKGVRFRPT